MFANCVTTSSCIPHVLRCDSVSISWRPITACFHQAKEWLEFARTVLTTIPLPGWGGGGALGSVMLTEIFFFVKTEVL